MGEGILCHVYRHWLETISFSYDLLSLGKAVSLVFISKLPIPFDTLLFTNDLGCLKSLRSIPLMIMCLRHVFSIYL